MSDPVEGIRIWPDGSALDGAMDAAFIDAVRRHRAANVAMVMWEDGEIRHVSPFEIALPGEDHPRTPELPVSPPASDAATRRAQGGH